jgi:MerR family transcriptional regulator, copper efflux regulator
LKVYPAGVTALRISEVAERTGLSTATLRYYETVGLVATPPRSDGGYRLYDQRVVDRLAFIVRAKQLGLNLEEIRELVEVWDGDECAPVQHALVERVAVKLEQVDARIAELTAFAEQLRATLTRLAAPPQPGPCSPACSCNVVLSIGRRP